MHICRMPPCSALPAGVACSPFPSRQFPWGGRVGRTKKQPDLARASRGIESFAIRPRARPLQVDRTQHAKMSTKRGGARRGLRSESPPPRGGRRAEAAAARGAEEQASSGRCADRKGGDAGWSVLRSVLGAVDCEALGGEQFSQMTCRAGSKPLDTLSDRSSVTLEPAPMHSWRILRAGCEQRDLLCSDAGLITPRNAFRQALLAVQRCSVSLSSSVTAIYMRLARLQATPGAQTAHPLCSHHPSRGPRPPRRSAHRT